MRFLFAIMLGLLIVNFVPSPLAASTVSVVGTNFQWTSANLAVPPGTWISFSSGGGTHRFASDFSSQNCTLPCWVYIPTNGTYPYHCGIHGLAMTGVITGGSPPVVTVADPLVGGSLSGMYNVSGSASSPNAAVGEVRVGIGPRTVNFFNTSIVATLTPSSGGVDWYALYPTTAYPNGDWTLLANVSAGGERSYTKLDITIANPPTRDLWATGLTADPGSTAGVTTHFTIYNAGNEPTAPYHVLLEYFYKGNWITIQEKAEPALAAHVTRADSIVWSSGTAAHVGRYLVRLTVDDLAEVAEIDEANNVAATGADWFTGNVSGIDPADP